MIDDYWLLQRAKREFFGKSVGSVRGGKAPDLGMNESERLIAKDVLAASSVLDIGAGNKRIMAKMRHHGYEGAYATMDVSPAFDHDFCSLEGIQGTYDVILMLETIEHMTMGEFHRYLDVVWGHLAPQGVFIVSTPNPAHINQFWKTDVDHIQPYPLSDLYAKLVLKGFGPIRMYRVHLVPAKFSPRFWLRRKLYEFVCKVMYADPAEGLQVHAHKP